MYPVRLITCLPVKENTVNLPKYWTNKLTPREVVYPERSPLSATHLTSRFFKVTIRSYVVDYHLLRIDLSIIESNKRVKLTVKNFRPDTDQTAMTEKDVFEV
jgi:hypothetical protein